MVTSRLDRMVRFVRRWRSSPGSTDGLNLDPDLGDGSLRRLRSVIDECVDRRGGEVAARRRARSVGVAFSTLSPLGRHRFFRLLVEDYGEDRQAIDDAIAEVTGAADAQRRRRAEQKLRSALEPRRERLLRALASLDSGLLFLVDLRGELRELIATDPALRALDHDLRRILESWFDVALLRLEQLTWDSPASLLERLIEYEAVHAIESWDDLKGRLGTGRRCYAFLHPSMPDDPLIFVEVALTRGVADHLPQLLDHRAVRPPANQADTAVFYSISNCHDGLAGVRLGDFLIKSVAERLIEDLPNIRNVVTLSPLPGYRRWLTAGLDDGSLDLTDDEANALGAGSPAGGRSAVRELVGGPLPPAGDDVLARSRPALMARAARYLLSSIESPSSGVARAVDPVAHFHLSNGAAVDRLNWWANPSAAGWERGLGMMVNYRYRVRFIESNHDRYVGGGEIVATDAVEKLAGVEPVAAGGAPADVDGAANAKGRRSGSGGLRQ